jgi:dTDP-glucose pyrophosphorylase
MKYNLIIPMAGLGSRFSKHGYAIPKPLLPIGKHRMFELVVSNLAGVGLERVCIVASRSFNLQESCDLLSSKLGVPVSLVEVDGLTQGPAITAKLGLDELDSDIPVVFANSDQFIDFKVEDWLEDSEFRSLDGSILVMRDSDAKWSYVRLGESEQVLEVKEKEVISNLATCGVYLFKNPGDFYSALERAVTAVETVNGEYYVGPLFNSLVLGGKNIGIFDLGPVSSVMYGLGTPLDYEAFKISDGYGVAVSLLEATLGKDG